MTFKTLSICFAVSKKRNQRIGRAYVNAALLITIVGSPCSFLIFMAAVERAEVLVMSQWWRVVLCAVRVLVGRYNGRDF